MFKSLMIQTILIGVLAISSLVASSFPICQTVSACGDCCSRTCQAFDIEVGWRRDSLDWKTHHLHSSYVSGHINDHILFKDINSYTISGQAKWVSSEYYIRLSAEYGTTDKGRAHEHFHIRSPYLFHPISVETSSPIKRRSEVYDFDGAVGYPLAFFCCRLSVVPLIGFSFHRQHLRVKDEEESSYFSSSSYYDYSSLSSSEFFQYHSSSSFYVSSSNPFAYFPSRSSESGDPFRRDPFSSPKDPNIASELGLSNPHRTSVYRFTWYGFYLGADIAYAMDSCWTLFWNTEFHFLDNCHRKRKSWTGVYFVDDYHEKGFAYGFNNLVGVTYHRFHSGHILGQANGSINLHQKQTA
jgi:hypothetical protein